MIYHLLLHIFYMNLVTMWRHLAKEKSIKISYSVNLRIQLIQLKVCILRLEYTNTFNNFVILFVFRLNKLKLLDPKISIMKIRLLLFFLLTSVFSYHSQIVINEYSCSNVSGITDAFGNREDWVELYNTTAAPIDLTGFYLSNKAGNIMKWQIPSGSIPANGFKMVFCSQRNTVSGTQLHPNFGLKQTKGDWIILANTVGTVVDSIKIIHMTKADHSVGRSTNGATDWKLFTTPTPNANNTGAQNFYEPTLITGVGS